MERLRKIYLTLVFVSLSMNMLWIFFRDLYWPHFSNDMQKILRADGYGSVIPGTENLFVLVLSVSILCYVGLFFFKRWAVWILIGLDIIVLLILSPFAGVEVAAPIERVAKAIFLMADGAIITLAFFSDLKSKFQPAKKVSDGVRPPISH